ncbi:MAG TPA: hypothetical protein VIR98_00705 [Candidatus Paceibacterota bacterium]
MQDDLGVISEFSITCGRIARTSGVPLEVIQRLGESKSDPFWVQLKDSLKRAAEPVEPILGSVATPVGQVQIAGPWVPTDDERKIVSRFVESNCKFWRDVHGIDLQLPDDVFPIFPRLVPGFGRYIVMPKIGLNAIWDGQLKSFKAWKYFDTKPEAFVTENERDAAETGLYVILVRESVEPDDDLCNMSAGMVKKRKLKTETLAERLVHGHQFFFETQQYLDVNDWTICSGSRYSGGGVPSVRWDDAGREVQVGWDGVGGRGPSSGPRAAVTL